MTDVDILVKVKKVISSPHDGGNHKVSMQFSLICLINSFIVTEFEYFFTVFVCDFSVLSCGFVFVNDCDFPDLFFHYFAQTIVI